MLLFLIKRLFCKKEQEKEQCIEVVPDDKYIVHLKVIRTDFTSKYTMGKLYVDDQYFCNTLEDTVRESGVKVYGETAIPAGKYNVIITFSPKFKRELPLLLNVPNFEGIRIHNGSYPEDSEGCILVGDSFGPGMLTNSKKTINELMDLLSVYEVRQYKFSIEIIDQKTNK
jgi:hypothetical protein